MKKSYFYILGGLGVVFIGGFFFLRNRTKQLQQQATATALQNLAPSTTQPQTTAPVVDPNLSKVKEIETELKAQSDWISSFVKNVRIGQMSEFSIRKARVDALMKDLDSLGYKWDKSTKSVIKKIV
jgi:hypothetical protein